MTHRLRRFSAAFVRAALISLISLHAASQYGGAPLLEPFHVEPRTVRLNPNAKATITEDLPCEERDSQHIVTHERG